MSRDLLPGPHDRAPIDRRRVCDVVMERIVLANRWASEQWSLLGVVPGESGRDDEPRVLREDARSLRWLYPGFPVELFPDEAEGCYLNLVAERPFVFVNWEPTDGRPRVRGVTVSFNEAARWMDGGGHVEGAPLPPEWLPWIGAFVDVHYKPEPVKRRIRPASFTRGQRDE